MTEDAVSLPAGEKNLFEIPRHEGMIDHMLLASNAIDWIRSLPVGVEGSSYNDRDRAKKVLGLAAEVAALKILLAQYNSNSGPMPEMKETLSDMIKDRGSKAIEVVLESESPGKLERAYRETVKVLVGEPRDTSRSLGDVVKAKHVFNDLRYKGN